MANAKLKPAERAELARSQSIGVESQTVQVNYSESKIEEMKTSVVNGVISLETKEEEYKSAKAEMNDDVKQRKKGIKDLTRAIRSGYYEQEMDLLKVPDYEEGIISLCDGQTGEVMSTRRMRPDERQTRIQ